jgi:phosphoglycerol transferase
VSLFGAYSDVISNATDVVNSISSGNTSTLPPESPFTPINILKREGLHSLAVNVLPLFLFFGTPIAVIAQSLINKKDSNRFHFFVLTTLVVLCLVGIIQLFQWTMLAIGQGQVELYWRYYEFALTLLLIAPAAYISSKITPQISGPRTQQFIVGGVVILFMVLAIWNGTGTFWINIKISKVIFYGFAVGSMLILVIWIYKPMLGSRLYLFILLPLSLVASNVAMYKHLQNTRMMPNSSAIGAFINSQLMPEDLKKVLVVQDTQLTQTVPLIFLKAPNLKIQTIGAKDFAYDLKNVPHDRDWVILMGNHVLVGEALANTHMQYLSFGDVTLFGGHGSIDINLQKHEWPGVIRDQKGLFNPPEPWGAWSIDRKVVFKFAKPLPRRFDLELTARAFGPNANKDILVHVGEQSSKFQLPATFPKFETRKIRIDNPNRLSEISIDIPKPVSPKDLGLGDDGRSLGIGFSMMHIKW